MEMMFTPVRSKIQRHYSSSTPLKGQHVLPPNIRLTPIRSKPTGDCGRCEVLKRLEQDLSIDIPVMSSPRLEIVRKRITSNHCKAIQRRKEKIRYQQNDAILNRKRLHLKEKDRALKRKYAELRLKMAAMLDSSVEESVLKKSSAPNEEPRASLE